MFIVFFCLLCFLTFVLARIDLITHFKACYSVSLSEPEPNGQL